MLVYEFSYEKSYINKSNIRQSDHT